MDRVVADKRTCTTLAGATVLAGFATFLVFLPASQVQASGFTLKQQSAAAQGNAFAGATAAAEDVTYLFFNPAGLTRHSDSQAALVANGIIVRGKTEDADGGVGGEPASGDAANDAIVPAAYGMWSVTPDLKLAVAVNAPFGLKTEYSQTWAGRYHAVESRMTTVNVNPAIAYRINDVLSIGAGVQIQYMDVTLSNMVFGLDQLAEVTGDDWGIGGTFGILAEFSDATRAGLGYRSQVDQTIEGDFTIGGALVSGASADFTSPDTVSGGIYHEFNGRWAVMAEAAWTRWSSFDEILVRNGGAVISRTPHDWEDVWFAALGASWKPNDAWTLRAGAAFDQSPIPDNRRTPRLTDADQVWAAIGAQFRPAPGLTIDASYMHSFIEDGPVDLPAGYSDPVLPPLTANFENSADIVSIQAVLHF